jgi:hypothetical protein
VGRVPLEWWAQLEAVTAPMRERRARKIEAAGKGKARAVWRRGGGVARDRTGRPQRQAVEVDGTDEWHAARAQAQRERFRRREACRQMTVRVIRCRNCGHEHRVPQGCGSRWVCHRCRKEQALRWQREIERKRRGAMWAVQRNRLHHRWRRKQRFGERFITLTVPHAADEGPKTRIQIVKRAWPLFRRDLMALLNQQASTFQKGKREGMLINPFTGEELDLAALCSWVRVLEWTPGGDGLGHPHLHLWVLSQFIPRRWIQVHWSLAVAAVRGHREVCMVDVRACGPDVVKELIKYLIKDIDVGGRVRVEVYGQVWDELEGARLRQSSAGFAQWELPQERICPECGHQAEQGWQMRVESQLPELAEVDYRLEPITLPILPRDGPVRSEHLAALERLWQQRKRDELALDLRIAAGKLRKAGVCHPSSEPKGQQCLPMCIR